MQFKKTSVVLKGVKMQFSFMNVKKMLVQSMAIFKISKIIAENYFANTAFPASLPV